MRIDMRLRRSSHEDALSSLPGSRVCRARIAVGAEASLLQEIPDGVRDQVSRLPVSFDIPVAAADLISKAMEKDTRLLGLFLQ